MQSGLVSYHERSPDPLVAGCRNTGETTDGVVFNHIEPEIGSFCFVGRRSIIEAVGVLFNLTPDEVERALDRPADDSDTAAEVPAPAPVSRGKKRG